MLLILTLFSLTLAPLVTFAIATRTFPFYHESIDAPLQPTRPITASYVKSSKNENHMTGQPIMGGARQISSKIKKCSGNQPTVEISLVYDQALCDRFSGSSHLVDDLAKKLVQEAEDILRPKTCIRLSINSIESRCVLGKNSLKSTSTPLIHEQGTFTFPAALSTCKENANHCSTASIILDSLRQQFQATDLRKYRYDAVVLLTGRLDGTAVAGAAFANSVCDEDTGFVWMEVMEDSSQTSSGLGKVGANAAVLAHEIGHLVGAPHDVAGVMRPTIILGDAFSLSDESAARILKFTEKDPRAWCLFREFGNEQEMSDNQEWFTLTTSLKHPFKVLRRDIHVAKRDSSGVHEVYALFASGRRACFSVVPLKDCPESGNCDQETSQPPDCLNLPVICTSCQYTSIALRPTTTQAYPDVIVGFVKIGSSGIADGSFMIGHRESDGLDITRWSEPVNVEYTTGSVRERAQIKWETTWEVHKGVSFITTGSISHSSATDLLWVFPTRENGRTTCNYIVGLDLDANGNPQKGWGNIIRVPGWFSSIALGFQAGIGSIAGTDLPDLIIFYQHIARRQSAHYVVGLDLNSTGHVTGGWSQFKLVPGSSQRSETKRDKLLVRLGFGIGIATLRNGKPFIVLPRFSLLPRLKQVPQTTGERSRGVFSSIDFGLVFSEKALEGMHYEDKGVLTAGRDVSAKCYECYTGDLVGECAAELKICDAWMDKVYVDTSKKIILHTIHQGEAIETGLRMDRQSQYGAESISCEGFNYLYQRRSEQEDGCDLTDFRKVMGNGVVLAFEEALNEAAGDVLQVEESQVYSDFGVGGVNGVHSKKIAATVTVKASNGKFSLAIRKAIRKLKRIRTDFKLIFKAKPKVREISGNRFSITFFYSKNVGEFV